MRIFKGLLTFSVAIVFLVSCEPKEDNCTSNEECGQGFVCDLETGKCIPEDGQPDGNTAKSDKISEKSDSDDFDSDKEMTDETEVFVNCTPGETRECYEGPSGTSENGLCKKGIATCIEDGSDWTHCDGQALPQKEICGNGIDENCDGTDWVLGGEMDKDIDNDGFTYCSGDCCETTWECPNPERVGPNSFEIPENGIDDNCDGRIDEANEGCDSGLSSDSKEPLDFGKSIGLCSVSEKKGYGLVSAEILFPDGTTVSQDATVGETTCTPGPPNPESYKILTKFGNVVKPKEGESFIMMSSGIAADPIPKQDGTSEVMCTRSNAPQDWYQTNGGKFPSSSGCGGLINPGDPGKEPLNDPVMLQLKVKAPNNASAFSVDVYFFSREFPEYVCQFNDFFVALLDSTFTSNDINLQNPADKNLAMDEFGNPVGINLAKSGLFRVCCNGGIMQCGYDPMNNYSASCILGPDELAGTGLYDDDKNGATGWLTTKGNIVPQEEFTIRLAIWDALDHVLDSQIIIDNFTWYESAQKPGTGAK